MAAEMQNTGTYSVKEAGVLGDIQIADEVIAIIAGLAATEVDGVAKMYGNITNELVSKLGMKNLSKGVKVLVSPDNVKVDLSLELKYGYSVLDVLRPGKMRSLPHRRHLYLPGRTGVQIYENQLDD